MIISIISIIMISKMINIGSHVTIYHDQQDQVFGRYLPVSLVFARYLPISLVFARYLPVSLVFAGIYLFVWYLP